MPRIPIIEQTTSASYGGGMPQAQSQPVVDAFGPAARQAQQAFSELAQAQMYEQKVAQHKADSDAVANTGKSLSDAYVSWKQYVLDAPAKFVDGGNVKTQDGQLVGFGTAVRQDFDKWSESFLSGIQNDKAKIYAQNQINSLRTSTLEHALTMEAAANIQNRSDKVDQAVETWAGAAAKDDKAVSQLILSAKTMIANSGFDERLRNAKAEQATNRIVEAAIHGNIERDPTATRAALIARYGVDPVSLKSEQQPEAQFVSGGGKAFDKALAFTLQAEGGFNKSDTNGTPSNFGINQKAHPEVDVKNITKAQAAAIYKKDYWDYIGGDDLAKKNPNLAIAAFDMAVLNKQKAKEFLQQSGSDVGKFQELRSQFLNGLVKSNPEKYGAYEKAWNNRTRDLSVLASDAGAGRGLVNPPSVTPDPGQPEPLPAFSPELKQLVDRLPPEKLPAYLSAATTAMNQQQAKIKSGVAQIENDHLAAFMNGQTVNKPLTQADYVKAYGETEGAQRFSQYTAVQQLGQDMSSMKAMTPQQMTALVANYAKDADPNKPGYDLAVKRLATLTEAANRLETARRADPVLYAIQNNLGASSLNFQNADAFQQELSKRQGVAATMQNTYGTGYTLLTKEEAQRLSSGFDTMTTEQKLGYLKTIKTTLSDPNAYRSVMGQIAPDSPVTAMAGVILSKQDPLKISGVFSDTILQPQAVAAQILEGEALLNPSKSAKAGDGKGREFPMPKDQDFRDAFNSKVGKAFRGDPNGANFAYQAVKAYYAGASARVGDVSAATDGARLEQAIQAVTGGISNINGKGEVLRPWGMSERYFKDRAATLFNSAMAANGYSKSIVDQFGAYGLDMVGENKYLLQSATGPLMGKNGMPIVLDFSPPDMRAFAQIPDTVTAGGPVKNQQTNGGRGWVGSVTENMQKPITQAPKTK